MTIRGILLAIVAALCASPAAAQEAGTIKPDKTVVVPSFDLPPSIYVSDQARKKMPATPFDQEKQMRALLAAGQVPALRPRIGQLMAAQIDPLRAMYKVVTRETTIAGVQAVSVTPAGGVPRANAGKILLDLPGGGFVMGMAPGTGMVESIPLAALAKVEIVSITYRQAPEAKYPAATEDVVKVYRELLKSHKPQDIAVFGCSAGGLLTAEAMAAFQREKLPLPAAIGIFCASADARWGGDSRAYSRPFQALPAQPRSLGYFEGANLEDPLVSPIHADLAGLPPMLIQVGSAETLLDDAMRLAGVAGAADVAVTLQVWPRMIHAWHLFYPEVADGRRSLASAGRFMHAQLDAA